MIPVRGGKASSGCRIHAENVEEIGRDLGGLQMDGIVQTAQVCTPTSKGGQALEETVFTAEIEVMTVH